MYLNEKKKNVTLDYFRSSLLFHSLDLYSYSNIRGYLILLTSVGGICTPTR